MLVRSEGPWVGEPPRAEAAECLSYRELDCFIGVQAGFAVYGCRGDWNL